MRTKVIYCRLKTPAPLRSRFLIRGCSRCLLPSPPLLRLRKLDGFGEHVSSLESFNGACIFRGGKPLITLEKIFVFCYNVDDLPPLPLFSSFCCIGSVYPFGYSCTSLIFVTFSRLGNRGVWVRKLI